MAALVLLVVTHQAVQAVQAVLGQVRSLHGLLLQVQVLQGLTLAVAVAVMTLLVAQAAPAAVDMVLVKTTQALQTGKVLRSLGLQTLVAVAVATGTTPAVHLVMAVPAS